MQSFFTFRFHFHASSSSVKIIINLSKMFSSTDAVDGMSVSEVQGGEISSGSMITISQSTPVDYKTLLKTLKDMVKKSDTLLERASDLNVKFGQVMTKTSSLIDPEVVQILAKKEGQQEMTPSQQNELPQEMDMKYAKMCRALANRDRDGDNKSIGCETPQNISQNSTRQD